MNTRKRLEFKSIEVNPKTGTLDLHVINGGAKYYFPIINDSVSGVLTKDDKATETNIVNTVSICVLPNGMTFSDLNARQRNAILDTILNNEHNQQYLNLTEVTQ